MSMRILAATDFSPQAELGVLRAAFLARQWTAELTLLHVVPPPVFYPGMELVPDASAYMDAYAAAGERVASERLAAIATVLRDQYDIPVQTVLRTGRAYRLIADYASAHDIDLVVVGARGENALARLLVGSTAHRMLRVRMGPVLVVRNAAVGAYRQPLAAVDFSPHSRVALAWAMRLAAGGTVQVVHVLPQEDEDRLRAAGLDSSAIRQRRAGMKAIAEELMHNLLAETQGQTVPCLTAGQTAQEILAHAAETQADVIVMGRHGAGGLEEWLLGSVSKDVTQATECDVLLVGAP